MEASSMLTVPFNTEALVHWSTPKDAPAQRFWGMPESTPSLQSWPSCQNRFLWVSPLSAMTRHIYELLLFADSFPYFSFFVTWNTSTTSLLLRVSEGVCEAFFTHSPLKCPLCSKGRFFVPPSTSILGYTGWNRKKNHSTSIFLPHLWYCPILAKSGTDLETVHPTPPLSGPFGSI